MMQTTYYHRYPRRPNPHQKKWANTAVTLGALALSTSWLIVGIGFGVAAVAAGVVSLSRATPYAKTPPFATTGIALGVVSIAVGAGVVGAML